MLAVSCRQHQAMRVHRKMRRVLKPKKDSFRWSFGLALNGMVGEILICQRLMETIGTEPLRTRLRDRRNGSTRRQDKLVRFTNESIRKGEDRSGRSLRSTKRALASAAFTMDDPIETLG